MTSEQTLLQIRVDTQLKEQAAEIFEKIGIDTPTAVRMFLKAVVRERGLPFGTNVSTDEEKTAGQKEAAEFMGFVKNLVMYEPPILADDENTLVVLPLENGREVSVKMFAQLVSKVPAGSITTWESIFACLGKLYGREVNSFPSRPLLQIDVDSNPLPYWRIVGNRGTLLESSKVSRELQREQLTKEGLRIVQRGSLTGSYKVENYQEHMFDFSRLQVIRG